MDKRYDRLFRAKRLQTGRQIVEQNRMNQFSSHPSIQQQCDDVLHVSTWNFERILEVFTWANYGDSTELRNY